MAFEFEMAAYPDTPADYALYGALDWIAHDVAGDAVYAHDLGTLQRACELAGIGVPELLSACERGFITISWGAKP